MTTFRTIEEFFKKRGISKSMKDILEERKKEKRIKSIKSKLLADIKKYPVLLSTIPQNKLKKIIEAEYKTDILKDVSRKVSDVKRLKELSKERRKSKETLKKYKSVLSTYKSKLQELSKQLNYLENKVKRMSNETIDYYRKAEEYHNRMFLANTDVDYKRFKELRDYYLKKAKSNELTLKRYTERLKNKKKVYENMLSEVKFKWLTI